MPLFEKYKTGKHNKTLDKMKKMHLGNSAGKVTGNNTDATKGLEPSKEAKLRMFSKKKN